MTNARSGQKLMTGNTSGPSTPTVGEGTALLGQRNQKLTIAHHFGGHVDVGAKTLGHDIPTLSGEAHIPELYVWELPRRRRNFAEHAIP